MSPDDGDANNVSIEKLLFYLFVNCKLTVIIIYVILN